MEDIIRMASTSEDKKFAALFSLAYAFLLRLPSEALPIVTGKAGVESNGAAVLCLDSDEIGPKVTLRLRSRKNRRNGSFLVRRCWCQALLIFSSFMYFRIHAVQGVTSHLPSTHVW